jgi:uncharacterized protein (DUF4415 family)
MSDTGTIGGAIRTTDGRVLIEQPDGSYRPAAGATDWARLDVMGEAELGAAIAADPDDPANDPAFWEHVGSVHPRPKERLTIRVDADVVDWFRQHGRGWETRMNAALRAYVEAQRRG